MRWLCLVFCSASLVHAEPPAITSLENPAVKYRVSREPYVVLQSGDWKAIVVDHRAVNDEQLPGHRAGYSGLAHLSHRDQPKNLFVPAYAGLNFEHIHDGTTKERDVLFEPRRFPVELRIIDDRTVELYQAPTGNWKLESAQRFQLHEGGVVEMTFECIPRADSFQNDYIGLFWASYIQSPESKEIHFRGTPRDKSDAASEWIRGITPEHGVDAMHPGANDERPLPHDDDFPLTLVFNHSRWRYSEPWYYGVSGKMAFVQVFREADQIRFSQSPSGGGGNPAWDFQWFIENPQVGKRYQLVMRAAYVPFESPEQIAKIARKQVKILSER